VSKKKIVQSGTYQKGTELTDIEELKSIIEANEVVYCKNQTIYDDNTQSITVEIHFNPLKVNKNGK
jgi:hypothetical protein